jgi:hypothetical protein
VIPSYRLYSDIEEIEGSPFEIDTTGRKPTTIDDVAIEIAAWDEIGVTWTAPSDDGGSDIVGYVVQWYDASIVDEPLEKQSIRFSTNVIGGSYKLSFEGYTYPFDIPYDTNASTFETILEYLLAIDDVVVTSEIDVYAYTLHVTFLMNRKNVSVLSVDDTLLEVADAFNFNKAIVCSDFIVTLDIYGFYCRAIDSNSFDTCIR